MEATDQQTREIASLLKTSNVELDHMTAKLRNLLGHSERANGSMSPATRKDRVQSIEAKETWTNDRFKRAMDTLLASGFNGGEQTKKVLEHSSTQKNFRSAAQVSNHLSVSRPLSKGYGFKDIDMLNSFARVKNEDLLSRPVTSSFQRVEEAYLSRYIPEQKETTPVTRSLCPSPKSQHCYHVPQAFKQRHKSSSNHSVRPGDNIKTRETIMIIPYQMKQMHQDFKDIIWNKENEAKSNKRSSQTKSIITTKLPIDLHVAKPMKPAMKRSGIQSTRNMDKFFVLMKKEEKFRDESKSKPVNNTKCQKVSKCVDSKTLQQAIKTYFGLPAK
jgi:hypothetical protein